MEQCKKCRDELPGKENLGPGDVVVCTYPPPGALNSMFLETLENSQDKANTLLRAFLRAVLEECYPRVALATASISLVADQVRLIISINTLVGDDLCEELHERDWQEQALLADERPITDLIKLELREAVGKLPIPQPREIETDIGARWASGLEHHPESAKLMMEMKEVDRLNGYAAGDMMDSGGDGDLGELLMFLMDVVFEQREAPK